MEPLIIIMVPGIVGGVLLALLIVRFGRPAVRQRRDENLEAPSTSVINMARIRVVGVGGLGMVAMATTVAIFVPRIRLTMAVALGLGVALAAMLIAWRRRDGPLPSSSNPGAHSMLPIDTVAGGAADERDRRGPARAPRLLASAPPA